MLFVEQILRLFACLAMLTSAHAYPHNNNAGSVENGFAVVRYVANDYTQPSLIGTRKDDAIALKATELLSYENSVNRLKRALGDIELNDFVDVGAPDDMELAEINVFRPLFRYRAQSVKPSSQQFG